MFYPPPIISFLRFISQLQNYFITIFGYCQYIFGEKQEEFMEYDLKEISERIKKQAKINDITLKIMLSDLHMGANTITHMASGHSTSAINLAKIADYLGCSVDYLLGRSEIRNTEQSHEDVLQQFNALSPSDQETILKFMRFLKNEE